MGQTVIDSFKKKLGVNGVVLGGDSITSLLNDNNIVDFIIHDVEDVLMGPEVKCARHNEYNNFYAEKSQKIF